jgi:hypothetical protein
VVRTAACCCGACAITVRDEPRVHGICHCDNCRRRTGSAFGWSAYFADDQVLEQRGDFAEHRIAGANPQIRRFCRACGTTLFWTASVFPGMVGVAGGCFVETPLPEPAVTVTDGKRCRWIALPDGWKSSI